MYKEIIGQVRSHIHELRDRIEEVQGEGYFATVIRRGPFIDGKRGHFLFEQLLHAQRELALWKAWAERDFRGPS